MRQRRRRNREEEEKEAAGQSQKQKPDTLMREKQIAKIQGAKVSFGSVNKKIEFLC